MNISESHHHDDANETSPIETLAAEYRQRAATLDRRARDLSRTAMPGKWTI